MTIARAFRTLNGQLEGVAGNVLGRHDLGLDRAGEEDIVLGNEDSIDSSIYSNAQSNELTQNREISPRQTTFLVGQNVDAGLEGRRQDGERRKPFLLGPGVGSQNFVENAHPEAIKAIRGILRLRLGFGAGLLRIGFLFGPFNLILHQFFVGRSLHRTENTDRNREVGIFNSR